MVLAFGPALGLGLHSIFVGSWGWFRDLRVSGAHVLGHGVSIKLMLVESVGLVWSEACGPDGRGLSDGDRFSVMRPSRYSVIGDCSPTPRKP